MIITDCLNSYKLLHFKYSINKKKNVNPVTYFWACLTYWCVDRYLSANV